MKRVLMISYYFPPLGGIGSVRALRFATHLVEFGWEPVVIAPRKGAFHDDPSLSVPVTRVYRTRNFEPNRLVKQVLRMDTGRPANGKPGLEAIRKILRRWVYRPDGQIGWYPFAVRAGHRLIHDDGGVDAVFSSSFPITAHLVARQLHRKHGIPWVAEFRDLWTDVGRESKTLQRSDEAIERSILTEANEIATVSPSWAQVLGSRAGRSVTVVTNAFEQCESAGLTVEGETVVTYLGTYYAGPQDLNTALRALGSLVHTGVIRGLRLRFIGDFPAALDRAIAGARLNKFVECTGLVPHRDALQYLRSSDILLLAGPVSAQTQVLSGRIPGKAFEYLGTRRPIVLVSDPSSDVANLLRPFPLVRIVTPGDVEGGRDAFLSLVHSNAEANPALLERFSSRSVTSRLAEMLERACR